MKVARTTYLTVLAAAALSGVAIAPPAGADVGQHESRGRWTAEHRGDCDRDGRGHRGRWDDRGRHWRPPAHRPPPSYRYGWGSPPRWAPPPRYPSPYPPRGYYAPRYDPPPRYYWRGGYGARPDWHDDGDVSLTIRVPL